MKAIKIYVSEKQDTVLRDIAKETGIKYAEHVRRALDMYLEYLKRSKTQ